MMFDQITLKQMRILSTTLHLYYTHYLHYLHLGLLADAFIQSDSQLVHLHTELVSLVPV